MDEATARLVERYLRGHAPSTLKDIRWWSGLTLKELRRAVEDLGDTVTTETVGGVEYRWPASSPPQEALEDRATFELLQVFDELFVGYSDTRGLLDADGEFGAILQIGYSRMVHVVVHGDRLAGRWRADKRAGGLTITFDLNRPLVGTEEAELGEAAQAYGAFVGTADTDVALAVNTR